MSATATMKPVSRAFNKMNEILLWAAERDFFTSWYKWKYDGHGQQKSFVAQDKRFGDVRRALEGVKILDVGAAPGGWTQCFARRCVSKSEFAFVLTLCLAARRAEFWLSILEQLIPLWRHCLMYGLSRH